MAKKSCTSWKPRFAVEHLRDLAGDKVMARGEAYFHERRVEILALDTRRVLARVSGSEPYRTSLSGQGASIDGDCSCPAFEDWGFCKHMVATALAANALRRQPAPAHSRPPRRQERRRACRHDR